MSAYGHQMERQISAQSLSNSAESSEIGSSYSMENGIYMSSFGATVLIAGLITVGVSLMTLLIALTVMLQSCETRNAGVIEYEYCKIFALHAELNSLNADSFPTICKNFVIKYIREGGYLKDVNTSIMIAENYLNSIRQISDPKDVVLIDIDDLLPANYSYPYKLLLEDGKWVNDLYRKLRGDGWRLVLISRRPEKQRYTTQEYLTSVGCDGWSLLIMRGDNEVKLSTLEYFSRQRMILQRDGFHIVSVISSHMDALKGPSLGTRVFKLPNLHFYHNINDLDYE